MKKLLLMLDFAIICIIISLFVTPQKAFADNSSLRVEMYQMVDGSKVPLAYHTFRVEMPYHDETCDGPFVWYFQTDANGIKYGEPEGSGLLNCACTYYVYPQLDGGTVDSWNQYRVSEDYDGWQRPNTQPENRVSFNAPGYNNGRTYTVEFDWYPPATPETSCIVNPSSENIAYGTQANFSYNGVNPSSGSGGNEVRMYLQRLDRGAIGGDFGSSTNARLDNYGDCLSVNGGTCYSSININNLPAGNYYVNCNVLGNNECSGNPFCSANGGSDTSCPINNSCSASDYATLNVSDGPCPTPTPGGRPVVVGLYADADPDESSVPESPYGLSGQSVNETGKNIYNPLLVIVQGEKANRSIEKYNAAFYIGSASSLDDVKNKLNNDKSQGFLLEYRKGDTWYVWDGGWQPIGNYHDVSDANGKLYTVKPKTNRLFTNAENDPSSAAWSVTFYKNFGNKNMNTKAVVNDGIQSSDFNANTPTTPRSFLNAPNACPN